MGCEHTTHGVERGILCLSDIVKVVIPGWIGRKDFVSTIHFGFVEIVES